MNLLFLLLLCVRQAFEEQEEARQFDSISVCLRGPRNPVHESGATASALRGNFEERAKVIASTLVPGLYKLCKLVLRGDAGTK